MGETLQESEAGRQNCNTVAVRHAQLPKGANNMPRQGDQGYQLNGRAVAVATRERGSASGTPARKERARESSAVQDPGLKDYVREFHLDSSRNTHAAQHNDTD